ncbi:hypothetical protein [Solicola sp. PLA-1-18]|uniref:hypothetical protein n=1 Tax=Solicola sp. PLA-1-18 TaxID=3380532 RepID=UPI003B77E4B2
MAAVVAPILAFVLAMLLIYERVRKGNYDHERRQIELEMMRRSLEGKIYDLNSQLVSTEERWRDANHLLLASQSVQGSSARSPRLVDSPIVASANVRDADLRGDPQLVFVLTPFHQSYAADFTAVKEACDGIGMRAVRGDEDFRPEDVFSHIVQMIVRARIIVANINGRNPNVMYELGIAQTLGKTTILVASRPEDVPFDVRARQLVIFDSNDDLVQKLRAEITKALVAEG